MEQAEVKYAPGMRIIVRGEEWMVKKVETNSLGNQTLYVIGLSQLVKDYESMFLVDVENDIEIVDPAKVTLVPDDSAFFRKSKVYIESQWRSKIPTDNKIHIGNKAAMDLMSYQLEPAQMALNKTRQRILIADTVGLGKTLEAGILMSELIARGKGKRILVVTVKSMMTQFQKEMWNRFTIPLVRLDSSRIQSVRAKLPTNYNPFFYYDKTIISVDTLKNDLDYRTHLENAWWDIIVIDEAHNVAKRGDRSSQRSKLASLLANRSDTLIMLTATPHDGKGQSVASLMNMLDPTAIADEENYTKDDIEGLLIRRFKKDIQDQVSGAFKERVITIERCVASAREEAAYDIFADMKLQMDESRTRGKGILFKTSLEKSLFSSPAACIKSIDARLRKLEKKYPDGDMPDIATLKELKAALELISPADFSRYAKLLKLLNSTEYGWSPSKNNDRLVIFTERIETMKYLAENLKKDLGLKDNQLEVMHGGMSDKELQRIVDEFGRAESPIRVIVASDVASEGMYKKGTFIYRLAGREREKSASYYTPEVLTKCLVKYALKELLKDKTADEILHLTVCEPAMGSAAFLNEAINQLAEAYLTKKQEELGETISYDKRFKELQKVKMFIADRNVYGCDLNPVAVELAEVSLWLNTIYKGAYVPWFGTQLVNGNSLIGARRQVYSQSALEAGKWYDKTPRRIMPGEERTKKGQHEHTKEIYHFLLGDPGMANYSDKVIKGLEPEKIKMLKAWNKEFTSKFEEDELKTVLRLSESIDKLWKLTADERKRIEKETYEPLSVYGHDELGEGSHKSIREKDEIYKWC